MQLNRPDTISFKELYGLTSEVSAPDGGHGLIAAGINERLITEFRNNGGSIAGEVGENVNLLLLTVTGAKSGKERIIPLAFFEIEHRIIIIASMGGSDKHPRWYVNLQRNADVKVEIGGGTFSARAATLNGDDRDHVFRQACRTMPVFAEYQNKTDRMIPIVELKRTA